ncbi:pyridoxine 5'-phosphate oxidase C-terminal domain-containing protein [Sphingomonas sp. BK235]|uniref:pyridoxine 5'-phosphate oxidase C-terminal domain-containing protein n=1 Tax=Sphingomonas sp. BK235 TaxID=2512131 RepID=UPI0010F33C05|nr:pyridoxine 5'-phosphate oxidase C-terminal domain-containing protein [Sphingomonas sp. BK235]TCP32797.1 pyridoxine 5'-phosphate oxidase-like protein [Sphingomonas sp. BK235]
MSEVGTSLSMERVDMALAIAEHPERMSLEELSVLAADRSPVAEDARSLDTAVAGGIAAAGLSGHFVPAAVGGAQGRFCDLARTASTLAESCASAAWCAVIYAVCGRMAAYLPAAAQRDIWGKDPNSLSSHRCAVAGLRAAAQRLERLSEPLPRPDSYRVFEIGIDGVEFWSDGNDRLHERLLYRRLHDDWAVERLQP